MTWYCAPIWGTSHGPLVIFRWPDWIPSLWIPVYHCTSTDLNRCVHPTRIPDYNPIEHRPTLYYHTWPHYTAILDYKPIEHRPTLYYYTQSHYTALPILHYLNTNQLNTGPYYSTTSPHHTTILDQHANEHLTTILDYNPIEHLATMHDYNPMLMQTTLYCLTAIPEYKPIEHLTTMPDNNWTQHLSSPPLTTRVHLILTHEPVTVTVLSYQYWCAAISVLVWAW